MLGPKILYMMYEIMIFVQENHLINHLIIDITCLISPQKKYMMNSQMVKCNFIILSLNICM